MARTIVLLFFSGVFSVLIIQQNRFIYLWYTEQRFLFHLMCRLTTVTTITSLLFSWFKRQNQILVFVSFCLAGNLKLLLMVVTDRLCFGR